MKTISTLLFTFFVVIAFAQTPYAPFAQVLSPSGSQELFLTSEGNVMCNVWNGHLNEKYAGQFFQIDQDGALLDDFSFEPLSNDNPKRIIELPDGNFFAAGLFYDPVNGDTLPNLLRLLPDGSIDPNFNSDLDLFYNIYSVEVLSSGDIWVAGIRRNHPGATLFEIAVLDADGKMKDFLPLNFTDSAVFGIKEQGPDSILIWGYLYLNGEGFGGIRIDEAGNIDPSFDLKLPSYTAVLDLKLDAFGRIITVGDYFYVHDANGTPQISLQLPNEGRSFSTNGNGDFLITTREGLIVVTNGNGITSIGDFDGSLTATCFLADGSPLVSGDFSNFNGHFQPGLVKLTSLSSNAIALPSFTARIEKPGRVNSFVKGLDNSVWMGGDFLYVNGIKRPNLCKLNLAGEIDPNFDLDSQGEILPIEKLLRLSNGNILAAGHYNKDELQNPSLIHGLTLFNPAGQVLLTGSDFEFGYLDNPCNNNGNFSGDNLVRSIREDADGKILALSGRRCTASRNNGILLYRLNQDGTLDQRLMSQSPLISRRFWDILPNANGSFYVCGTSLEFDNLQFVPILRFNHDGSLDNSFTPPNEIFQVGYAMQHAENEKPILVSVEDFGPRGGVFKLNADGSIDQNLSPMSIQKYPRDNAPYITGIWPLGNTNNFVVSGTFVSVNNNYLPNLFQIEDNQAVIKPLDISFPVNTVLPLQDSLYLVGGYFNGGHFENAMSTMVLSSGKLISTKDVQSIESLVIYPNPIAQNHLEIQWPQPVGKEVSYIISDLTGQQKKVGNLGQVNNKATIPSLNLPSGLYLLQLKAGEKSWAEKIRVE